MKVLCPQCERLIALDQFRLDGAVLIITCTRCGAETKVEPGVPEPTAAAAPGPARTVTLPPRVSLASTEGGSNVVVLRTAGHEAVQKAALAADEGPFTVPEGLCPKCIARRAETDACPHCGIVFKKFDEASVLPPKWLREDWVTLLRDWGNEAKHGQLRRKAQQADALAAVGRLYRLRQAAVPEDPTAEAGRADVLRMAAVAISFRTPEDAAESRRKAIITSAVVVMGLLILTLLVQVLRTRH